MPKQKKRGDIDRSSTKGNSSRLKKRQTAKEIYSIILWSNHRIGAAYLGKWVLLPVNTFTSHIGINPVLLQIDCIYCMIFKYCTNKKVQIFCTRK